MTRFSIDVKLIFYYIFYCISYYVLCVHRLMILFCCFARYFAICRSRQTNGFENFHIFQFQTMAMCILYGLFFVRLFCLHIFSKTFYALCAMHLCHLWCTFFLQYKMPFGDAIFECIAIIKTFYTIFLRIVLCDQKNKKKTECARAREGTRCNRLLFPQMMELNSLESTDCFN